MKILYLLDTFPSATETFIAREIKALRERGFEIEIWAFNAGEGTFKIPQPLLARLDKNRWRRVGEHFWLTHRAQIEAADHIHAAWASMPAEVAQMIAEKSGRPWSFFAHAHDLWVGGGDLKAKLQSAKWAASCTRNGTAQLQSLNPQAQVFYAPHGLDLNLYTWRPWQPASPMKLLGVGRLVEKKGWPEAIAVAHDLNIPLEIIGEGPLRSQLNGPNLTLRGALPHSQVIQAMQEAACLILPSRRTSDGNRDGLANVLLEAAALGLPIVTTDAGSAGDLIDETTGRLVESDDFVALREAVESTLTNIEATRQRCINARQRVEQHFDIQKNIEILAALFRAKAP